MTCPRYGKCSAPMCPLERDSIRCGVWFPDDEICKNRKFIGESVEERKDRDTKATRDHDMIMIKQQRKIQKSARDRSTYYTRRMLIVECIVKKGITGIDPDKPEKSQVKRWIKKHPPISEKRRTTSRMMGSRVGVNNLSNRSTS